MKRMRSTNIAFALLVFVSLAVPVFAGGLFDSMSLLQNMIVSEVIYVAVALITVWIADRPLIGQIQQNGMKAQTVGMVILAGLLLQPVMTWLNIFSMMFVRNYVSDSMLTVATGSVIYNLLYIALAPAVAEEFIYRGLLYHGYRQLGVLKAACLSGVLFGLMHMNWNQFVYAFAMGVILALVVEASGSIYSAMIIHFMINAQSVLTLAVSSSSAYSTAEQSAQLTRSQLLPMLLVYTPVALLCATGVFFAVRRIARLSGRTEFFDLALQGQEQSVKSRTQGSEKDVRESREKARAAAKEVLKEETENVSGLQEEHGCPAEQAARYAAQPNEEWRNASRRSRLLAMLPALIGAAACIIYMFWVELF